MYTRTLSENAQNALALLGKAHLLPAETYLAGGSALALHFGHRISVDFDFFTPNTFNQDEIIIRLSQLGLFELTRKEKNTLLGVFEQVKFSLFTYDYSLLFEAAHFQEVAIANPKDIAAMKLAAIMDRGTKKDFIDSYFLNQKGISLDDTLTYYDRKYKALANNLYSIITSLSYFGDAEKSDMPHMLEKISWEEVKEFFQKETLKLAEKYI